MINLTIWVTKMQFINPIFIILAYLPQLSHLIFTRFQKNTFAICKTNIEKKGKDIRIYQLVSHFDVPNELFSVFLVNSKITMHDFYNSSDEEENNVPRDPAPPLKIDW